ncbi:MAG: hypothetical protein AAGA32_13150, partial [Pseudomonadota bacterium]
RQTGAAALKPDELAACARLAERLPAVESYLRGITPLDLGAVPTALDLPEELALIEGSPLFTMTLYLQLQRNALVAEAAHARYAARDAAERMEPGLSASILNTLLKFHDLKRAGAVLEDDLPVATSTERTGRDWAYFFAQACTVKDRAGRKAAALRLAELACAAHRSLETLRRVGLMAARKGDRPAAITAFQEAETLGPLPAKATARLSRWLAAEGRTEEAERAKRLADSRGGSEDVEGHKDADP